MLQYDFDLMPKRWFYLRFNDKDGNRFINAIYGDWCDALDTMNTYMKTMTAGWIAAISTMQMGEVAQAELLEEDPPERDVAMNPFECDLVDEELPF